MAASGEVVWSGDLMGSDELDSNKYRLVWLRDSALSRSVVLERLIRDALGEPAWVRDTNRDKFRKAVASMAQAYLELQVTYSSAVREGGLAARRPKS